MNIKQLALSSVFLLTLTNFSIFESASTVWVSAAHAAQDSLISFKPPVTGKPTRWVGGGTRSAQNSPALAVLTTEQTGLTISSSPTLYWASNQVSSQPVKISIIYTLPESKDMMQPVFEADITMGKTGIQALPLSHNAIELQTDIEYQWSVSVKNPGMEGTEQTLISRGTIKRVAPSASLQQLLQTAKPRDLPEIYADHGLWYDAFAAVSQLIAEHPDDPALREMRASLLSQVGLKQFAQLTQQTG
ncbi:DUF928 domain-containing protein [Candidatus Venteria ishoeyi]|uniref:DUF928 domain-containing protein n=1 Tax=Candidatus Venteria ishoeyi TaxID=1899563 RepID=A0A1H6FBJ1_9GAMM|nr:DUF928 domain-containing protein [Candidatus Venteria ishoeyi]SEH07447.1 Uncharacterised protein [Candidatus Venteria ishoeyi]